MIKVDFLIGGTQKGGATALDACLRQHPAVRMAFQKETHFFDTESNFPTSGLRPDYNAYHQHFPRTDREVVFGEATPIYMYWYSSPRRIWEYNPAMKWILLLRNPVERAYSHWNMERSQGNEALAFSDAIRREGERCREALPFQHRIRSFVDRGFYSEQIRRIRRLFPQEQLLCLKSEELRNAPADVLVQVSRFLSIPPFQVVCPSSSHNGSYVSTMPREDRDYLLEIFDTDIRSLEAMLGWDCRDWMK